MQQQYNYTKSLEEALILWPKVSVGKATDFSNQKINHWTILYRTKDIRRVMWVAQCDCGNIAKLRGGAWSNQCAECQHVMQQRNYTGEKFNKLTVLNERESRNGKTYVKCRCDCGQETWVSTGNLTSGQVKSCGCLSHEYNGEWKDITNQVFGKLTVIGYAFTKDSNKYWNCRCECGKETIVPTHRLTSGTTQSCGCKKLLNITPGDKFGKLTVISKANTKKDYQTGIVWNCSCDCGTSSHLVLGSLLVNGSVKSCGCGKRTSYNEENIASLLSAAGLTFKKEYIDEKLNQTYPSNGHPRAFDFFVDNKYFIEFDGSQHFYYKGTGWDTEEHFKRTRHSDLLKNKYCFEQDIPLIRIPYDVEYTIEDLQLETTRFLLTSANEMDYYNNHCPLVL